VVRSWRRPHLSGKVRDLGLSEVGSDLLRCAHADHDHRRPSSTRVFGPLNVTGAMLWEAPELMVLAGQRLQPHLGGHS
jgi:hypothetical protein